MSGVKLFFYIFNFLTAEIDRNTEKKGQNIYISFCKIFRFV